MKKHSTLRQARKNAGLTVQDMAYLFNIDISNISKYENGTSNPPVRIIIGYHLISKMRMEELISVQKSTELPKIISRAIDLIEKIEQEPSNRKNINRVEVLNNLIKKLEN